MHTLGYIGLAVGLLGQVAVFAIQQDKLSKICRVCDRRSSLRVCERVARVGGVVEERLRAGKSKLPKHLWLWKFCKITHISANYKITTVPYPANLLTNRF